MAADGSTADAAGAQPTVPTEPAAGPPLTGSDWCWDVVEASPDGVVVVDDGLVAYVNPALEQVSGWRGDELVGQPVETLVPHPHRAGHEHLRADYARSPRRRAMGEGRTLELRRADGSGLAVEIALAPVQVGHRAMTIATVRDVSARSADDAARAWLADLLDLVPDSIVVVDRSTGRVTGANRAALELLGWSRDELVGMETARLQPHDAEEADGPTLLTDGRDLHRVRLLCADGTTVDCEVHATTVRGSDAGELVVNVVRDIGERLRLERRLRESEETFRTAFEQAPVGIAVIRVDHDGRRTVGRSNEAFTRMFGYDAGGLDGVDPAVLHPTADAHDTAPLSSLVVGGELADRTVTRRYTRQDGTPVWADVRATRMELPNDPDSLFLVRAVDVTARFDAVDTARRRARATECVADVARAALEHRDEGFVFERIATGAMETLEAEGAAVLLTGAGPRGEHVWGAVVGEVAEVLANALDSASEDQLVRLTATAAADLGSPSTELAELLDGVVGPVALAPFGHDTSPPSGVVLACRGPGGAAFGDEDVDRLARLATQTQVALHLARARADQQRLALMEERQRIARELHDTVIQDVIAVGMQINADIDTESDPVRQERDLAKVAQLEAATHSLRRAVFELRGGSGRTSTATELTDVVALAAPRLGHFPSVVFSGPVDTLPDAVVDDLVGVLREALANVARHARATASTVEVTVAGDGVMLTVDDNGVGPDRGDTPGYGLEYARERARRHGGRLSVGAGPVVGTRLVWTCPVPAPPPPR